MVNWEWLLLAFFVGALVGMTLMSLMIAAGRRDDDE